MQVITGACTILHDFAETTDVVPGGVQVEVMPRPIQPRYTPPAIPAVAANNIADLPNDISALRFRRRLKNELIEITNDVVLSREAFEKMRSTIADLILSNGPATVSQLRSALKSSRRVMVPLLERLDREGFTRRVGDQRTLAQQITRAKLPDASSARQS